MPSRHSDGGALPLSGAQQALWFAQQLDPRSPAFSCAHAVDIRGPVDRGRLLAAITEVTAAADVLHRAFEVDGDTVWQVPRPPRPVEVIDLSTSPDPRTAADDWMRADLARPIDLLADDAARQALLVVAPEHTVWYVRAHHILLDGYAFSMLEERVSAAYAALGRGEPVVPGFAGLDTLLDDERAYDASERSSADRDFWRDRCAGGPDAVSLSDVTATAAHTCLHVDGDLSAAAGDGLRAAAQRCGATWVETALALTALYVHRMTGAADVVVGVPVAGRLGTAGARVPSTVVNVLPMRLTVTADTSLRDLVGAVQADLKATRRHQRYRYERLQRDLGLVGSGRRLFGPQVNIKPFRRSVDLGDAVGRVTYLATGPTDDLEVTVGLDTDSGRFTLGLDANPRAYTRDSVVAHRDRLAHLLERVAGLDPDAPVADVEVLTDAERDLVLHGWNDTAHPVPTGTLTDLLDAQAAATPDVDAVVFEGEAVTYAQLHRRANRLAHRLISRGAGPGNLVAVALPRGVDLVVALLAVLKAGAAYLPLDLSYPADRLAFMRDDAQPVCVLDGPEFVDGSGFPDFAPTDTDRIRPLGVGDTAYAIYTSGSTGRPKGVLVPHRGIVNRLAWMQGEYGLTAADRVLQKTPSGFDVSVWEFFWPLITGATLVVARPDGHKDPAYLADLIVAERISTLHFVPSMLRVFLAEPAAASCGDVLRRVICSGEELPEDLARQVHRDLGVPLHNLYGPTEASVDVTFWPCRPEDPAGPVPIGRPVWNTRMYVLDDRGRPVPPGAVGELYIAGVQVASGYLNRPELTAERFVSDPWGGPDDRMYRTGDLARWRSDGALDFLGRTDHQVKIRGFRVELGEIEAVLHQHSGVTRAAVVPWSGGLCGYVVPGPGFDPDAVRAHLAATLPDHMVPSAFVELTELPLTTSGKLDRKALPAPAAPAGTAGAVPRTPYEDVLCRLVAETLGLDRAGPDDGFFDLGGHSLLAAVLIRRIREVLGVALPLGAVFAAPTSARLASLLTDGTASDALDVVLPLRPRDAGPALFCVHPAGGLSWCYSGLLPHLDPAVAVYGLQARALSDPSARPESIDAVAEDLVNEIRAVRPHGPYRLAGWSVGGVIAQAIAVRLRDAGESVELLALLDAYPSDQWRDLPSPDEADALRALLHMAGRDESAVDGPLELKPVLAALRRENNALAELGEQTLAAIVSVVVDNARMMREHEHRPFDGDAVFFTAAAPRPETWLTREAWRPHITGRIDNHDLDCAHPGMVTPSSLAQIAKALNGVFRPGTLGAGRPGARPDRRHPGRP
jgi:enterobactin synthetase component F